MTKAEIDELQSHFIDELAELATKLGPRFHARLTAALMIDVLVGDVAPPSAEYAARFFAELDRLTGNRPRSSNARRRQPLTTKGPLQ